MTPRPDASHDDARRGDGRRLQWAYTLHALDFEVATRAGVSVAVPLITLALFGRLDLALYASFGAFTSLFGRSEVYRTRLRTAGVAAVLLVTLMAGGVLLSTPAPTIATLAIALVPVLAVGVLVARTFSLHPPTPVFFTFTFLVCAIVPVRAGEQPLAVLIGAASATFALIVTMSGWLLRLGRDVDRVTASFKLLKPLPRRAVLRPQAWRDPAVWLNVGQLVVGAMIAGGLAELLGLGHSYWAVVSLVAVVPPVRATHSLSRTLHRTFGTVAGVVATALVLWGHPSVWLLIMIVVVCQFGAEIFVGRHYGTALVFITPLALLMVHLAAPATSVSEILVDRAVETALGAAVGMAMVLLARLVRVGPDIRRTQS